ncbi:MAG: TetR/AcrR family transcriptional regulator, partial [Lachnospiraceae bacterium]|nr:TetR/AcrR family transcriptional regulator [Lachnospiraceae bacterium]
MKERILEGGMAVYRKKGPKFTMDDLANELGMSKKTIYTVFRDKKSLLYDMVDYTFDAIKAGEAEVLADNSKNTIEKLRGILGVMPERF